MAKKAKKSTKRVTKRAVKKTAKKPMKKTVAKKTAAKKTVAKRVPAKRTVSKVIRAATAAPKARGFELLSASPGLTANDAEASIKWYCDVLGFRVKERWEHEGKFLGAEIASGNVSMNVGQDDWKMGRDRVKGQGTRTYITTGPDIDDYAAAIKARGGTLAQELENGWGMRMFSINDPDGFKITFFTLLK